MGRMKPLSTPSGSEKEKWPYRPNGPYPPAWRDEKRRSGKQRSERYSTDK